MEGVVQRTGHPYDHDRADAHGDASRCEHAATSGSAGGGERRHDDSTAIIIPPISPQVSRLLPDLGAYLGP
jgi:hypothetical protein